jgi:hypothetical protein
MLKKDSRTQVSPGKHIRNQIIYPTLFMQSCLVVCLGLCLRRDYQSAVLFSIASRRIHSLYGFFGLLRASGAILSELFFVPPSLQSSDLLSRATAWSLETPTQVRTEAIANGHRGLTSYLISIVPSSNLAPSGTDTHRSGPSSKTEHFDESGR